MADFWQLRKYHPNFQRCSQKTMKTDRLCCLLKIIECLQYLARQAMPMQGDTDKETNFTQLLKLREKDQPVLLKWLARKEDKYTSHEIQNQIISIMAKYCLPQFSSRYLWWIFALIADECTDISNNMYPMDLINTWRSLKISFF